MTARYTHKNLLQAKDAAPELGLGEWQESRFVTSDLDAAETGVTHHRFKAGKRHGFAHRHGQAEELYVVLSGSGRVKLDEDILDLAPLDALRVAPDVLRSWEAGPDGLEVLAFGSRHEGDAEFVQDWWTG
jgi:mannose-6-phosphate isomerase-like protein (cupin superfamily)